MQSDETPIDSTSSTLPGDPHELLRAAETMYGTLPRSFLEVVGPYTDHPTLGRGYVAMELALAGADATDEALKLLITTKVALLLGCRVCAEGAAAFGVAHGISATKLAALPDHGGSDVFSAKEALALDYATAVTLPPGQVSEELRARLGAAFSRKQLIELAASIAMEHYRVRFRRALLDREDESGTASFCLVPPAHPSHRDGR